MTAQIMAYVPGRVPQMTDQVIIPDWANNRLYSIGQGNVGNPMPLGISQFTGYISGDLTLARTIAEIGLGDITAYPAVLTKGGQLVVSEFSTGFMASIRASNLTLSNRKVSMPLPGTLAAGRYKGRDYVFGCPGYSIPDYPKVYVMGAVDLNATLIGTMTETGHPKLVSGSATDNVHLAFAMGQGSTISDPTNPNRFGLYTIGLGSIAPIMHGTPPTIDATWTTFSSVQGLAYDQTDGNLMATFSTNDVVTNQNYLVKFNATSGAVMWKIPIYSASFLSDLSLQSAQIKNGRFHFWMTQAGVAPDNIFYTVDTIAGTIASLGAASHMKGVISQASEDTNNSVVGNGTWNESGTVPTYIGTYMGTLGNHGYGGWMRWFPAGATAPLPPAPPPTATNPPIVSVNRAWTYTLDGHTFYVLDLGAQGTFAYDMMTEQWTNFVTGPAATDGGNNPQWNMQNGCMWGTRVVGSDLALAKVWEMTPGAVLDNDAVQIAHVSTGAIASRGRDFSSCDVVRVVASFGYLDSVSPVTFNLRFSDDMEHSWSPNFSVTLTPGVFGGEIAWRSLGSFASPGRVFELSDTGGLIRIDGADVYLDGFDAPPENDDG